MTHKGSTGGSLGGMDKSPDRRRREADRRRRQERRWAGKSGPVNVRYVCPVCGGDHARADCPQPAN